MKRMILLLGSIFLLIFCDKQPSSPEENDNGLGIISYSFDNGTVSPPGQTKTSYTFYQNGVLNQKKTGANNSIIHNYNVDIGLNYIDTLIQLVIDSNMYELDTLYHNQTGLVGASTRWLNFNIDSVSKLIQIYGLYENELPPSLFLLEKNIIKKIEELESSFYY